MWRSPASCVFCTQPVGNRLLADRNAHANRTAPLASGFCEQRTEGEVSTPSRTNLQHYSLYLLAVCLPAGQLLLARYFCHQHTSHI